MTFHKDTNLVRSTKRPLWPDLTRAIYSAFAELMQLEFYFRIVLNKEISYYSTIVNKLLSSNRWHNVY